MFLIFFLTFIFFHFLFNFVHLLKNMGLRRQAASHLQHPRGPAEVSRLLSVSEARVWSVDMEEMSLMEEDGGRLSLLFTAAPVLKVKAVPSLRHSSFSPQSSLPLCRLTLSTHQ